MRDIAGGELAAAGVPPRQWRHIAPDELPDFTFERGRGVLDIALGLGRGRGHEYCSFRRNAKRAM